MHRSLLLGALVLAVSPARAQQGGVRIAHAWSRPAMAGRVGVAYLTVTDDGAPDQLVGASSPIATRVELHRSVVEHGVARMQAVSVLPVAPGKPAVLAPGGYHFMLLDLKQPLVAGHSFPLTLRFANAGTVATTVSVAPAGGSGMGDMPGMTHATHP